MKLRSPAAHLLLCGPVPNRPRTATGPQPGSWGPLLKGTGRSAVGTTTPSMPRPAASRARGGCLATEHVPEGGRLRRDFRGGGCVRFWKAVGAAASAAFQRWQVPPRSTVSARGGRASGGDPGPRGGGATRDLRGRRVPEGRV